VICLYPAGGGERGLGKREKPAIMFYQGEWMLQGYAFDIY